MANGHFSRRDFILTAGATAVAAASNGLMVSNGKTLAVAAQTDPLSKLVNIRPTLLDGPGPKTRSVSLSPPKIGSIRLPDKSTCKPVHSLVYGWQAMNPGKGLYNFAFFPVEGCTSSCSAKKIRLSNGQLIYPEYDLHILPPGGNPRKPEQIRLNITDISELISAGKTSTGRLSLGGILEEISSWAKQAWDTLTELVKGAGDVLQALAKWGDEVVEGFKAIGAVLIKFSQEVVKPLIQELTSLMQLAGPLALAMAKGVAKSTTNTKAYAALLVNQAQLLNSGTFLPHQKLALSLQRTMNTDPVMIDMFISATKSLNRYKIT